MCLLSRFFLIDSILRSLFYRERRMWLFYGRLKSPRIKMSLIYSLYCSLFVLIYSVIMSKHSCWDLDAWQFRQMFYTKNSYRGSSLMLLELWEVSCDALNVLWNLYELYVSSSTTKENKLGQVLDPGDYIFLVSQMNLNPLSISINLCLSQKIPTYWLQSLTSLNPT